MKISFNSLINYTYQSYNFSFSKEKKITVIACLAFGLLACCYKMIQYCFKNKKNIEPLIKIDKKKDNDKEKIFDSMIKPSLQESLSAENQTLNLSSPKEISASNLNQEYCNQINAELSSLQEQVIEIEKKIKQLDQLIEKLSTGIQSQKKAPVLLQMLNKTRTLVKYEVIYDSGYEIFKEMETDTIEIIEKKLENLLKTHKKVAFFQGKNFKYTGKEVQGPGQEKYCFSTPFLKNKKIHPITLGFYLNNADANRTVIMSAEDKLQVNQQLLEDLNDKISKKLIEKKQIEEAIQS